MSVPKIPSGQSQEGQLGAGCSPESTHPRPWGGAPGAGPTSLSPAPPGGASQQRPGPHCPSTLQPAQEATRQCCNVTLTLPDLSWCCRHHVQVGSGVETGWAQVQVGSSCSPGTQHRYLLGFPARPPASPGQGPLPPPAQQLRGRPGGAGGVRGVPTSPLPFLPALCPRRSSPSSAAASTTASDTRWPCPAQRSRTPQVRRTAAGGTPGGRAGEGQQPDPNPDVVLGRGRPFVNCVALGKALNFSKPP